MVGFQANLIEDLSTNLVSIFGNLTVRDSYLESLLSFIDTQMSNSSTGNIISIGGEIFIDNCLINNGLIIASGLSYSTASALNMNGTLINFQNKVSVLNSVCVDLTSNIARNI